jgi:hypothetical protein
MSSASRKTIGLVNGVGQVDPSIPGYLLFDLHLILCDAGISIADLIRRPRCWWQYLRILLVFQQSLASELQLCVCVHECHSGFALGHGLEGDALR